MAAAAGWTVPALLAALVVQDAVAVAARLPGAIGADLDPIGLVLVPDPERSGWLDRLRAGLAGRRAVVGPAVPMAQAHRSVARAQAAWPLHVAGLLRPGVDRTRWSEPTSTCSRCCWPPSRSWPPT